MRTAAVMDESGEAGKVESSNYTDAGLRGSSPDGLAGMPAAQQVGLLPAGNNDPVTTHWTAMLRSRVRRAAVVAASVCALGSGNTMHGFELTDAYVDNF